MNRWFRRLERHLVVIHHNKPDLQSIRGYAVSSDHHMVTLTTAELLPDVEGASPVKMAGEVNVLRENIWFVQTLKAGT